MSHAIGACKFKDGTIMFCEYDGCVDFMRQPLFKTYEALRENWKMDYEHIECEHDIEEVELYSDYGRGFYWTAKACKKCNRIIERLQPDHYVENRGWCFEDYDEDSWYATKGTPEWAIDIWK